MKEDLERRESEGRKDAKRKRGEYDPDNEFERELRRLAEEGRKKVRERKEQLRREAQEAEIVQETQQQQANGVDKPVNGDIADIDRSVSLRFEQTCGIAKDDLISRFERFGEIEEAVLKEKKIKIEGEKHRRVYTKAVLLYKSVVGAHAAVSDFAKISITEPEMYAMFEDVGWAAGKEPGFIPKPALFQTAPSPSNNPNFQPPITSAQHGSESHGGDSANVPKFSSFKGTMSTNGPGLDDITMIRLKNAERRRLEEKIRREEAAAAVDAE